MRALKNRFDIDLARAVFKTLTVCAVFFFMSEEAQAKNSRQRHLKKNPWHQIETVLRKSHFSNRFIKFLKSDFQPEDHARVLRLNTLGFLNQVDHHTLVTPEALSSSKSFLEGNQNAFQKAEEGFGVDREVIAALLWVETRHGTVRGNFHVPSVFASLAVADKKEARKLLYKEARKGRLPASLNLAQLKEKIKTRTRRKAKWALGELRVIERIYKKHSHDVLGLKGSFAGAFGISQFLPSSYERHAFTDQGSRRPDLYENRDAILSVANYLKNNGWGPGVDEKKKALFSYNNSDDYVDAILALSEQVKAPLTTTN